MGVWRSGTGRGRSRGIGVGGGIREMSLTGDRSRRRWSGMLVALPDDEHGNPRARATQFQSCPKLSVAPLANLAGHLNLLSPTADLLQHKFKTDVNSETIPDEHGTATFGDFATRVGYLHS